MLRRLLLAATALLAPAAASAEWREAETPHFVIWSDSSESELRRYAERLEGLDQVLRLANSIGPDVKPHKVRVVLAGDVEAIKRAYGGKSQNVAGFYTVNEAGPLAVSPRRTGPDSSGFGDVVLAHEYAHHFMLQYFEHTYPSWLVEGFAELASTAAPMPGGKFSYGKAASHRGYSLTSSRWMPVAKLMTSAYGELNAEDVDFYGQSWLLTHYLTFDPKRSGQLKGYVRALNGGRTHEDAAKVFGDLSVLNRDARKYLDGGSFTYKPVPVAAVDRSTLKLRTLSAGEAGLIPETIAMRDDVDDAKASAWLAAIRAKVARFPGDRYALRLQADAEYVAEEYDASAATAGKVLALAPDDGDALARRGMALLRGADDLQGAARTARVKEARGLFVRAFKAAPGKPLPLIGNYQAERMSGKVTEGAVNGLAEAVAIVPQDDGVRMMLVAQLADDRIFTEALRYLGPVAFSPHASSGQKAALKLYEELKTKRAEATRTFAR